MSGTSARLLRLLSLLQSRHDWSGAELADRLGVTARTLRRDVQRLRDLGYPVHASPGVAGGYQLGAGAALPPLLLDDEEAVAVAVGLRTAAGGTVAGIEETSVRALGKLEQVLPSRLRRRVDSLGTFIVPVLRGEPGVDAEVLTVIAGACRTPEVLRFGYRDYGGTESRRKVEPHRLVNVGGRWYLLAWDVDRDDWRVFRVDRIHGIPTLGRRVSPRTPPTEAGEYVAAAVSNHAYEYRARILLRAPESVAAERVTPLDGVLRRIDDETCELHTGAPSLDVLAIHVALIGIECEVLDPPELIERVRWMGALLSRAAR